MPFYIESVWAPELRQVRNSAFGLRFPTEQASIRRFETIIFFKIGKY